MRGLREENSDHIPNEYSVLVGAFIFEDIFANFGQPFNVPPEFHVDTVSSRCVKATITPRYCAWVSADEVRNWCLEALFHPSGFKHPNDEVKLLTHGGIDEMSLLAAMNPASSLSLCKCLNILWGCTVTTLFQE